MSRSSLRSNTEFTKMWVGYSISRAVVYLLPLRAARAVPSLRSDEQPAT